MKYYAIVTFGAPMKSLWKQSSKVYRNRGSAIQVAAECMGTGSCTTARVYECDTFRLANTADISEVRQGEKIVWHS